MNCQIRIKLCLVFLYLFCSANVLFAGKGLSETEIREKVKELDLPVNVNINKLVKKEINRYVVKYKERSEIILGRSSVYFPIIEDYLAKYNLPDELKYLVAVESSIDPSAHSKVGAAGLWQFMPKTGKAFGLDIDNYVDERLDPYKSTEAAMQYLAKLHSRYDDWALALAAYNCGPTRVNKAIRSSGSRDFWKLSKFLPKETRQYVPRYIAFCYVGPYHQFYDINPRYPDYNDMILETVKMDHYTTFKKIAHFTGISVAKLKKLNPSYKIGIIPARKDGNYIILPRLEAIAYKATIEKSIQVAQRENSFKEISPYNYYVQNGENLKKIAELNQCDISDILNWNALENELLFVNQKLKLFPEENKTSKTLFSQKLD